LSAHPGVASEKALTSLAKWQLLQLPELADSLPQSNVHPNPAFWTQLNNSVGGVI